jgi:hypothetical protein
MNRILLFMIALLALSSHGMAQHYSLYGLEIYNPHFKNPAFTGADKIVQADYLRHSNLVYSGNKAYIMTTLPGDKNAVGINFENGISYTNYSSFAGGAYEVGMTFYNVGASYSHTFHLSEELELHAGGRFDYGKLNFLPGSQGIDSPRKYIAHFSSMLGVGMDYRNWELGLSVNLPLARNMYSLTEDNTLEKEKRSSNVKDFYFFSRYESQSKRRVTFDPVFGLDCSVGGNKPKWYAYAGGIVQIVDVVGLGITVGNMVSVSANLNILDRAQLMFGVYGGEKIFQDGPSTMDYRFSPEEKRYFVQLRINL